MADRDVRIFVAPSFQRSRQGAGRLGGDLIGIDPDRIGGARLGGQVQRHRGKGMDRDQVPAPRIAASFEREGQRRRGVLRIADPDGDLPWWTAMVSSRATTTGHGAWLAT